jgi:hypothetical protein
MAEGNGNGGFKINAGPIQIDASGATVINVLLAGSLLCATAYMIYTTHQQTVILQQDHSNQQQMMNGYMGVRASEHMTLLSEIVELKNENRKMFLSSILTDHQKKQLSTTIQEKAKEIVEKKADEAIKKLP